jgi:thiol-disulfide isomerase/thioredoxin
MKPAALAKAYPVRNHSIHSIAATLFFLAAVQLFVQNSAQAQQAPQSAQTRPQDSTSTDLPEQSPTPSLAEAARLARANKQPSAKPAKLLDDDNFPRTKASAGDKTPDLAVSTPGGKTFSLLDFRGKVVLLDFWASWCGPCRSALPKLKQLQSIFGSDQFVVISVSEDEDERTWRAFVSNHQMNWLQHFDAGGSLSQSFSVRGLPTYILIGRDGTILRRYVGEDLGESILERVAPDLKVALEGK